MPQTDRQGLWPEWRNEGTCSQDGPSAWGLGPQASAASTPFPLPWSLGRAGPSTRTVQHPFCLVQSPLLLTPFPPSPLLWWDLNMPPATWVLPGLSLSQLSPWPHSRLRPPWSSAGECGAQEALGAGLQPTHLFCSP